MLCRIKIFVCFEYNWKQKYNVCVCVCRMWKCWPLKRVAGKVLIVQYFNGLIIINVHGQLEHWRVLSIYYVIFKTLETYAKEKIYSPSKFANI